MTLTKAVRSNASVSASSEHSRFTSSYEPSTATRVPPYTAVWMIFAGSRSAGTSTIESRPARAACAATELARLPVDAQATRVKPSCLAAVSATETTRSLKEWVGFALSSLTHSDRIPSSAASRSARTSGVRPGSRVTRVAGSCPTGSSPAYRQSERGPASITSLVM